MRLRYSYSKSCNRHQNELTLFICPGSHSILESNEQFGLFLAGIFLSAILNICQLVSHLRPCGARPDNNTFFSWRYIQSLHPLLRVAASETY